MSAAISCCVLANLHARDARYPTSFGDKCSQVSSILHFNRQLEGLKGDGDLVPGVGRTSVWGGKYDSASGEGKSRDLRDLFKVYIEERLRRDGEITEVRCSYVEVHGRLACRGLQHQQGYPYETESVPASLCEQHWGRWQYAPGSVQVCALWRPLPRQWPDVKCADVSTNTPGLCRRSWSRTWRTCRQRWGWGPGKPPACGTRSSQPHTSASSKSSNARTHDPSSQRRQHTLVHSALTHLSIGYNPVNINNLRKLRRAGGCCGRSSRADGWRRRRPRPPRCRRCARSSSSTPTRRPASTGTCSRSASRPSWRTRSCRVRDKVADNSTSGGCAQPIAMSTLVCCVEC